MRLPSWLITTLLTSSLLAVLGAAGWWWVTWPQRTALLFAALVSEEKWDSIDSMVQPTTEFAPIIQIDEDQSIDWSRLVIEPQSRSASDVVMARQFFRTLSGFEFGVDKGVVQMTQFDLILLRHGFFKK